MLALLAWQCHIPTEPINGEVATTKRVVQERTIFSYRNGTIPTDHNLFVPTLDHSSNSNFVLYNGSGSRNHSYMMPVSIVGYHGHQGSSGNNYEDRHDHNNNMLVASTNLHNSRKYRNRNINNDYYLLQHADCLHRSAAALTSKIIRSLRNSIQLLTMVALLSTLPSPTRIYLWCRLPMI